MQIPTCFCFCFSARANEQTQWTESANKRDVDMRTRRKQRVKDQEQKKTEAHKNNRHNSIPPRTKPCILFHLVFFFLVLSLYTFRTSSSCFFRPFYLSCCVSVICQFYFFFSPFFFDSKLGRKDWCLYGNVCVRVCECNAQGKGFAQKRI